MRFRRTNGFGIRQKTAAPEGTAVNPALAPTFDERRKSTSTRRIPMRTPSIRTLAAIAYERGEEFDPALMLSPALAEQLDNAGTAGATVNMPSPSEERRCRQKAGRRETQADAAPVWFEAGDLVPCPFDARHGELLSELAC
jgi:hypothetical protein